MDLAISYFILAFVHRKDGFKLQGDFLVEPKNIETHSLGRPLTFDLACGAAAHLSSSGLPSAGIRVMQRLRCEFPMWELHHVVVPSVA